MPRSYNRLWVPSTEKLNQAGSRVRDPDCLLGVERTNLYLYLEKGVMAKSNAEQTAKGREECERVWHRAGNTRRGLNTGYLFRDVLHLLQFVVS
jgi:hypothetical protein